jgi:hypothetical protein
MARVCFVPKSGHSQAAVEMSASAMGGPALLDRRRRHAVWS